MTRNDGRAVDQLRPVHIERGFLSNSHGSALYRCGKTTLLVAANVVDQVPPFLKGKHSGWLTAEYAMLPGSTPGRKSRGPDGRSTEIQRLVGRSLRAVVDLELLGPLTIHIDADILQADGGTRTAAITAAFVALVDALHCRFSAERVNRIVRDSVAAVSVGLLQDEAILDLDYKEDSSASVDFNVIRLGQGGFVEIQGTGEDGCFTRAQLQELLDLAERGLDTLEECQREALGDRWPHPSLNYPA